MKPRPYLLIGAELLGAVRAMLDAAAGQWCADWGVVRDAVTLDCHRAWSGEAQALLPSNWQASWRAGDGALHQAWSAEWPVQVQRALFAPDRSQGPASGTALIAKAGAAAACRAWSQQLATLTLPGGVADPDPAAPATADGAYASGALLLALRIGKQVHCALLNHHAVQALGEQAVLRGAIRREPALPLAPVDYRQSLADVPLALTVEAGRARVGLGSMMSLGVGDVIRLDTGADFPLQVAGPSGAVLFDAYLGLADGDIALEVVRHEFNNGVINER
jgi:flagellar motor switch/type III secretory pathway protein FliN